MPKKILITEEQERKMIKLINESSFSPDTERVILVKNFLDNGFVKQKVDSIGANGYPTVEINAIMKNLSGQPVNSYRPRDLFLILQDKFQTIYPDRKQRDAFLKQVAKDWLNGKITKDGVLSTNSVNK